MNRVYQLTILALIFLMGIGSVPAVAPDNPIAPPDPFAVPYFAPPASAELCGEPVPLQDQDVFERFDREFTIVVNSHAQVYLWLKRLERYFPWLEDQLRANNLPEDLKYVAVAESDLMPTASSPAGAVGPWQFISSTAKRCGLNQSGCIDERRDFQMATEAAFRYLVELRGMFQNWTLAVAAYNCGENRVKDEIARQKVSSYYQLRLPQETERYIFRILAIKTVLSNPERYGYRLPKGAGYPERRVERICLNFPNPVPVQALAEAADMTYRELKILNPCFTSDTIPAGYSGSIAVPPEKGKVLESRFDALREQYTSKPPSITYTVKRGDTLTNLAARYDVSVEDLKKWNGLQSNDVRIGQALKILK